MKMIRNIIQNAKKILSLQYLKYFYFYLQLWNPLFRYNSQQIKLPPELLNYLIL